MKNLFDNFFYIVSYPRSGNTWMVNSLKDYIGAQRAELSPSVYGGDEVAISKNTNIKLTTELDKGLPVGIKTHHYYKQFNSNSLPNAKIIYLYRDCKDVLTSYFFYKNGFLGENTLIVDDFDIQIFNKFLSIHAREWKNHIEGWSAASEDILFISYESLKLDYKNTLIKVKEYLGLQEQALVSDVESMHVKNFKRIDQFDNVLKGNNNDFYRKGEVGDWKNYFDKDSLVIVSNIAGKTSRKYGYTLE